MINRKMTANESSQAVKVLSILKISRYGQLKMEFSMRKTAFKYR